MLAGLIGTTPIYVARQIPGRFTGSVSVWVGYNSTTAPIWFLNHKLELSSKRFSPVGIDHLTVASGKRFRFSVDHDSPWRAYGLLCRTVAVCAPTPEPVGDCCQSLPDRTFGRGDPEGDQHGNRDLAGVCRIVPNPSSDPRANCSASRLATSPP